MGRVGGGLNFARLGSNPHPAPHRSDCRVNHSRVFPELDGTEQVRSGGEGEHGCEATVRRVQRRSRSSAVIAAKRLKHRSSWELTLQPNFLVFPQKQMLPSHRPQIGGHLLHAAVARWLSQKVKLQLPFYPSFPRARRKRQSKRRRLGFAAAQSNSGRRLQSCRWRPRTIYFFERKHIAFPLRLVIVYVHMHVLTNTQKYCIC
jgi:hypothetical protein